MSVLLYDDEAGVRDSTSLVFKLYHIPYVATGSLDEASGYFTHPKHMPDTLIADLSSEDENGNRLAASIREKYNLVSGSFGPSEGTELVQFAQMMNPKCRIFIFTGDRYDPTSTKIPVWGVIYKGHTENESLIDACKLGPLTQEEQIEIQIGRHAPINIDSEQFTYYVERFRYRKEQE